MNVRIGSNNIDSTYVFSLSEKLVLLYGGESEISFDLPNSLHGDLNLIAGGCTDKGFWLADTVRVNVANVAKPSKLYFSLPDTLFVHQGESVLLHPIAEWSDGSKGQIDALVYSDNDCVSIDGNRITALYLGTATISASAEGVNAYCNIKVVETPEGYIPTTYNSDPISISLSSSSLSLSIGETSRILVSVEGNNIVDKTITLSTSDENIATVDGEGLVTAIRRGTAIIAAFCDNTWAECRVTVGLDPVSISLDKRELNMAIGDSQVLIATVTPDSVKDKIVEWTTSDASIVTVDGNGLVTAVAEGEAVITATCDNVSAQCNVNVIESSGIGDIEDDGLKVTAADGVITVKGALAGSTVEVYCVSGACIAAKTVESSVEKFAVATHGVYLVRAGDMTFKVVL